MMSEVKGDKNSPSHRIFLSFHGIGCIIKYLSLIFSTWLMLTHRTTISEHHIEIEIMTIRIPPENLLDKVLKLFGRERKVIIQTAAEEIYRERGPYVQIKEAREGFFKALFRKGH